MLKIDYIVNSFFSSITWLLSDEESSWVWLVDCGDVEPILEKIGERSIAGVMLTHTHFDHIYGLNELVQHYPTFKVYTSQHGVEGLKNPKINMSRYHDEVEDFIYQFDNIEILVDKQVIDIEGEQIKVLETPGHDWSCLTYHIGNFLFTGDSYIPNTKPQFNFPKGNKELYQLSEERILHCAKSKNLIIKPGHIC